MKLMIASDIHGSAYYCKKLLEQFQKEQADKLILLGDILYHGPRNDLPKEYNPKQVIELLNEIKSQILCVRGNCDTEVDQMVLQFPILADYSFLYLNNKMVFITHGHNFNLNNLPMLQAGDILLHGHTHIPTIEKYQDILYLNPGSVSIPKQNSPNSYMLLTDTTISLKDLEGKCYQSALFSEI